VISGCLSLPARLLSLGLLAGVIYVGWVNRDEVRRWINRKTADPVVPAAEAVPPGALVETAAARLDSLARRRADSVILDEAEVTAMVAAELERRAAGLMDSVTVSLTDGEVAVRALVDADRLPAGSLGPLAEWIKGRQSVKVSGPLNLLRLGTGEWRIDQVTVRGLPLPRPLWERMLSLVVPGARSSFTFPVDQWITGIRMTPNGAILYGQGRRR